MFPVIVGGAKVSVPSSMALLTSTIFPRADTASRQPQRSETAAQTEKLPQKKAKDANKCKHEYPKCLRWVCGLSTVEIRARSINEVQFERILTCAGRFCVRDCFAPLPRHRKRSASVTPQDGAANLCRTTDHVWVKSERKSKPRAWGSVPTSTVETHNTDL